MNYQIVAAKNKYIGIVWQFQGSKLFIENIFLPCPLKQLIAKIKKEYPAINKAERKIPGGVAEQIAKIYAGEKVNFNLSFLNWEKLSVFSGKVLKATCEIPLGKVATYSGLAAKSGSPHAARAVGTALANNPFPLVIPCHRVVRADGSLGGFGGGIQMKKELLNKEDVVLDSKGRVAAKCFQPMTRL
ncbi:MAG: methylated-DNA--[protein]-cysteine S-methyltransferase [Smithellaceae bacterium]